VKAACFVMASCKVDRLPSVFYRESTIMTRGADSDQPTTESSFTAPYKHKRATSRVVPKTFGIVRLTRSLCEI
jgi:hypothetical protein